MKNGQKSVGKVKVMPLGDRVLVRPHREEDGEKTKSGIYIPDTIAKEKPGEGEVIAVGEGRYDTNGNLIPIKVKVGDTVMFSKYAYEDVKVGTEDYYILKEDSILAIIK